jgi:hypothetical protein
MLRWGILAIVFDLRWFLNLSLISLLAGVVIFGVGVALVIVDPFVCTLGVGAFMIGLLIVAAIIWVVVCVCWEVVVSFGFGAVSLSGQVAWSKVTRLFSCSVLSGGVENVLSELFKMSSIFLSALICSNPFMLFFLLMPALGHLALR